MRRRDVNNCGNGSSCGSGSSNGGSNNTIINKNDSSGGNATPFGVGIGLGLPGAVSAILTIWVKFTKRGAATAEIVKRGASKRLKRFRNQTPEESPELQGANPGVQRSSMDDYINNVDPPTQTRDETGNGS
jgi:hypothetical protein